MQSTLFGDGFEDLQSTALLDLVEDALIVCDLKRCVSYWNEGAENLYGWARSEAIGQTLDELIYIEPVSLQEAYERATTTDDWAGKLASLCKDGGFTEVESHWRLFRGADGQARGFIIRDTKISKRSESSRSQEAESVGELTGDIAHELNNILTPIIMSSRSLRDCISSPDDIELVATIEECAQRGAALVQQLLGKSPVPAAESTPALEESSFEESLAEEDLPHGRELILIVDDDPAIRKVCQTALESFGYQVITANDGVEAIQTFAARRREFMLVLTDIAMPDMDGHALMYAVRKIDPTVSIVAMSGLKPRGELATDADKWLIKPFATARLLTTVRNAIDARIED
ncbi:MAG: response regulator [Bradymonadaceae bacterium]